MRRKPRVVQSGGAAGGATGGAEGRGRRWRAEGRGQGQRGMGRRQRVAAEGGRAWKSASSLFMFASALERAMLSRRTCHSVLWREATWLYTQGYGVRRRDDIHRGMRGWREATWLYTQGSQRR